MLSRTPPIALDGALLACLTVRSQVSSQDALKHTPGHAVKDTHNCARRCTPSLLNCTLPSKLSRCSQAHSRACSQVHSQEARHFDSHLTICSQVCVEINQVRIEILNWLSYKSDWLKSKERERQANIYWKGGHTRESQVSHPETNAEHHCRG